MNDRFLISFVYLVASLILIPPMFKEGFVFDVSAIVIDEKGNEILEHGIYFDNVFFTILFCSLAWICLAVPIILGVEKYKNLTNFSFIISSWSLAGFIYEFANLFYPTEVFNDGSNKVLFSMFVIALVLSTTLISIKKQWNKRLQ